MAASATPATVTKRAPRQPPSSQRVHPPRQSALSETIDSTIAAANDFLKSGDADNPLYLLIANLTKLLGTLAQPAAQPITAQDLERERSIVVAGLAESADPKPSKRSAHDAVKLTEMLDTIDSEAVPVAHYRMGQPGDHPRLLKVVFASRQHQREVLSLFPKMAKEKKDDFPFSNVYVRRSMTFEERQADKLLRDEVKRRQENHEKCWVYAGRIVTERVQKPTQSKPQGNRY
ncbi:hypothetical protein AAVH_19200 [Aphelenchoides avenae]|nr:hypothetical protein AAVH_19200 [Aphelenchus avenae]